MPHDDLADQLGIDPARVRALQGLDPDEDADDDATPPTDGRLVDAAGEAFHLPTRVVERVREVLAQPADMPPADPMARELGLDPARVHAHQGRRLTVPGRDDPLLAERLVEAVALEEDVRPEQLADAVHMANEAEARAADPLAEYLGLDPQQVAAHQGRRDDLRAVPVTPGARYAARAAFYARREAA